MSATNSSADDCLPVQVCVPQSLQGTLHQLRHAKKMSDDELVSTCLQFCLRLVLDAQIETGKGTPLSNDLYRAVLDVRGERRTLLDVISGAEKSLADARALLAAFRTRSTP